MTAFETFYPVMRAILGDRQVGGMWNYTDADLLSALRAVFALGRAPEGYAMDPANPATGANVTPDVALGDVFALIAYDACLILVAPEDGKNSYRTRSISVTDGGDRKRDLLFELERLTSAIRDGDCVFATYQTFAAWAGVREQVEPGLAYSGIRRTSGTDSYEF